jgi:hypothetical protein
VSKIPARAKRPLALLVLGNALLGAGIALSDWLICLVPFVAGITVLLRAAYDWGRTDLRPRSIRGWRRPMRASVFALWEFFCIGIAVFATEGDAGGVVFASVVTALLTVPLVRLIRWDAHGRTEPLADSRGSEAGTAGMGR